ncbi:interleukin-18-like [Melanotaenia boesemani]|uniref:interleukin-18-like n=1 Tax=Melanotaenia boesemani TaxID=1250792 RepID=UPI001C05C11D|nr:interleukin-18-like [Melanotaenia boesemani]
MAASHCDPSIPIRFQDICQDSFYFTETETDADLQEDDFCKCGREAKTFMIESNERKFLILTTDGTLEAQDLDQVERGRSGCKFNIQEYLDSSSQPKMGKPVMLYASKDGQKMVVCCRENGDVYPKPMDLPTNISGEEHEAMFYQERISCGRCRFESTMYKNHFLAFEPDQNIPGLYKLLLHYKGETEVDESCNLTLTTK